MSRLTLCLLVALLCSLTLAACDDDSGGDEATQDTVLDQNSGDSATPADVPVDADATPDTAVDTGLDAADTGLDVADTAVADTAVADTTADAVNDVVDTNDVSVAIHTAGCEAALGGTCAYLATCPNLPTWGQVTVGTCAASIGALQTQMAGICQTYLGARVAAGDSLAVWLNDASAADVQTCVNGQPCTQETGTSAVDALVAFLGSSDPTNVDALLQIMLAGCFSG